MNLSFMKKLNMIFYHLKIQNIYFINLMTFKIQLANRLKIKYSVVTDNYIAAEEIQNQNW